MVFRTRTRTLSREGCKLFNIGNAIPTQNLPCLKSILYKLFTTDFDIKLEKSKKSFRMGTCNLYSFLSDKKKHKIPDFFNNAVINLVYLILVDGININNRQKIRHNISFYYSLAELAFKNGDHNTVFLLKAALENNAIKRLKLKPLKKQTKLLKKFEETYGTFMSCNARHLKQILKNKDVDSFLPSIVILIMHLNKTKEYAKCYESIGKFPKSLRNKHNELQNIIAIYYDHYKDCKDNGIDIYLQDPHELRLLKGSGSSISTKLYELSLLVK